MGQIIVTRDLAAKGLRVVRGPGWEYGEQDGGEGNVGIIAEDCRDHNFTKVKWLDSGRIYTYRVGHHGKYDLAIYQPFTSPNVEPINSFQKVQAVREAMSQSIKQTDFITEKLNTKHGSSTNTDSFYGAIKVRRPIIKIQGAKR